jgi:hypothetical protein
MAQAENIWPKSISVDKRIVRILSESTYENFPRALKELITNSYDADARNVKVIIDVKKESLIVEDDGRGMNEHDFSFYIRIAGKKREKEDNTTQLGRKIIGQFGVGFLSIFPFFKSYHIESKKSGTRTTLHADIPLFKYFSDDNKALDIDDILINGGKRDEEGRINQSFTKITLSGFNELTKSFFFSKQNKKVEKTSIKSLDGVSLLKWTLSEDLPLPFKDEKINAVFGNEERTPFSVTINGEQLYRNSYGDKILETHKGKYHLIGKVKCQYFIATPGKIVQPIQGRYYKIRNLNVGVGDRDDFGIEHGERSHIRWLYGEVHILDGMNNLIKVSRDGFNFSNDFEELKKYFNSRLQHHSTKLEKNVKFQKEVKQTGKQFRVSDISLLQPENLNKQLESFKREGYYIRKVDDVKKASKPIRIDEENREILISRAVADFEKHMIVQGKKYKVQSDKWNYNEDFFPACKLKSNILIINQDYPLFHSVKYNDIFVKFHLMLLLNLESGILSRKVFSNLVSDVLKYYIDYQK